MEYITYISLDVSFIQKILRIVSIHFRWTTKEAASAMLLFFGVNYVSLSFSTNDDFFYRISFSIMSYFSFTLSLSLPLHIRPKVLVLWSERLLIMQTACLTHSCSFFFPLCCRQSTMNPFAIWIKKYARKKRTKSIFDTLYSSLACCLHVHRNH